jgi:hypothetical protein
VGELVELQFTLPYGPVTVYATVRQRSAFRYGFQFVDSPAAQETIQSTCRSLEMEQSQVSAEKIKKKNLLWRFQDGLKRGRAALKRR